MKFVSLAIVLLHPGMLSVAADTQTQRPDIHCCLFDQASYLPVGADGADGVETPAFDRMTAQVILSSCACTDGSGAARGGEQTSAQAQVPASSPGHETVRNDLLDDALQIEYADQHREDISGEPSRIGAGWRGR